MSDLKLAIKLTTEGGQIVVKDLQQVDAAADKVSQSLGATGKTGAVAGQGLSKASGGADVLTGSLKSMLAQAAGVIALGLGIDKIASGMYDGIDAFQGYRGQLKTITGDFDSASAELDRLIQISKETPFTLAQSVEGFTKLTHLGLDPSKKSMISYGNTAAAMNKDLMQMIEAVADASVGEFERLKEFGIKASSEGENVKLTFNKVSTTIKKDAASIEKYLFDLGNNKFGDAMGDQMIRLSAKSSNLQTSIAQLYDEIGQLGAADGIGSSIDGIASSISTLTEHLPEVIGLLSTLTDIVMVGGVAYLGLKAIPLLMGAASAASKALAVNILATSMAYKAGVTPVALFAGGVKASTMATMEAVVATGLLKSALIGLFSAYAGWQIGSYLSEQFVEVRVAGLSFVGAMETGLVNLSYSFSAVAPKAKQIWGELTTWLKNKLGSLYSLIGDGLASIGADDMALGYKNFAESLTGSSDAAKAATKELAALEQQRKAEIETVDNIIVGLINHEYAQQASTNATNKNTEAKKKNNQVKPSTVTELTNNQKLIVALAEQVHMLGLNAKQKLLHTNLSKLSAKATLEDIATTKALTEAQYEQLQVNAQKQNDSEFIQGVIDGANDIGESWSAASNVIVNAFGSIGDQLDKLAKQQENYAAQQKRLAQAKLTFADDPTKLSEIAKAENALAQQKERNAMSEISSYRAITDSAANMFSENSKGRKAMQAASDVFTAVELANSALRIGSYAIEAITAAFAAPWPMGFASGAAMIAILAGLGVAVSGGSGSAPMSAAERQETQGTGTVLGSDDKSASIYNALERAEDLQLDQYAVLREMLTSLDDLNNNITRLATSFVSNFGKFDAASYSGTLGKTSKYTSNGYFEKMGSEVLSVVDPLLSSTGFGDPLGGLVDSLVGSFNTTKKSLVDSGISIVSQTMGEVIDSGLLQAQQYFDIKTKKKSWWGLSSSSSYDTEFQDVNEQLEHEMSLVFQSIGSSINAAVDVLGFDITNSLNDFVIDLPNMSFKDLSGDEIQAELEAIFSSQSDLMATYLVQSLKEYQQVGEGLYETLIRLAQEQAVFNSVLELTGNAMAAVDANTTIAATQAIIEFAGGIENLQDAASTFFSEFLSDDEQFAHLQKNLTAQFEALGKPLPATADAFKDLIQTLDPLNEAEQQLYAQLLLLSGQSAEYYDALEEQQQATKAAIEAEKELAIERMNAITSLKNDITDLVDDLVNPGVDYQSLIKAEETRWKNQQDAAETLYKTEMSRYESALSAEQTLDEYINGLAFSDNSTLAPWQQQELARTNFSSAVTRAENGDFSAVSDATSAASQYLDIGKERYGGDSDMYRRMFIDVNTMLSELSDFYATFEAPEQQIIEESPELISLREQLAASEAAAKQAENQALADLLTSQLGELSDLSGDSINSLIESFSIDLSQLGELLSVNLLELIDVTKQGLDSEISTVNTGNIAPLQDPLVNNVVAFPVIVNPVAPGRVPEPTSTNNSGNYAEVVTELKLLREEVAAFRADSNDNADEAVSQRQSQINTAETQTEEIVRSNLRQVSVS